MIYDVKCEKALKLTFAHIKVTPAHILPQNCPKLHYLMKYIINNCYWMVCRRNYGLHFFLRILAPQMALGENTSNT